MTSETSTKPPKLGKKRYHHGDLRAGLIEATRRLIEEKGADGFSVSDACRLAGVSTAAPYKHFKDKNEMMVAVLMEGMERMRDNQAKALADIPPGSSDRIKVIGMEYVKFAMREPEVFRLKFGNQNEGLRTPEAIAAGEATFGAVLREVADCLGEQEITPEVRRRGFLLWSFVHGLSFLYPDDTFRSMGGEIDLEATLDDVARRVLA